MDEMRQIADVIGVGMGDENGLNAGLLGERKLRSEGPGVDCEPVVDQVARQVVFSI